VVRPPQIGTPAAQDRLAIEHYGNLPAVLLPYDPHAPEVAERVSRLIVDFSPQLSVEHIGSTSIPGAAGKGVIDLMVLYPDGGLAGARDTLAALGFQRQTTRDPFPEDRPMRTGAITHRGVRYLLHAHVLPRSGDESNQLRAFRDRLRSDPEELARYVAFKRDILARGIVDTVAYAEAKGAFFPADKTPTSAQS